MTGPETNPYESIIDKLARAHPNLRITILPADTTSDASGPILRVFQIVSEYSDPGDPFWDPVV